MNKRKARATARAVAQAEILGWHREFLGKGTRVSRPTVRDGVVFYQVGQNASHDFFAGVDADGRKFRMTSGEEAWDEDGNPKVMERVHEVAAFSGHYFGHY